MLSESITERALELVMNRNSEFDIAAAVREAIIEERNLMIELMEQRTERSVNLINALRKKVYAKIALADAELEISKF